MEFQDVLTAISTVGFPIVACAAMFWLNYRTAQDHKEESEKMNQALDNNTLALQKLIDTVDNLNK